VELPPFYRYPPTLLAIPRNTWNSRGGTSGSHCNQRRSLSSTLLTLDYTYLKQHHIGPTHEQGMPRFLPKHWPQKIAKQHRRQQHHTTPPMSRETHRVRFRQRQLSPRSTFTFNLVQRDGSSIGEYWMMACTQVP